MLYAIGEIILVVIGILIALSINNWNTNQKEKVDLHSYLKSISSNIKSDRVQTEKMIIFRDSVTFYSSNVIASGQKSTFTANDFRMLINDKYSVFYDRYLEINSSGFELLKNSPLFGKIQGSEIEKLLNDYYILVNSIAKQEKSLNDFFENMELLAFQDNIIKRMLEIIRNPMQSNTSLHTRKKS